MSFFFFFTEPVAGKNQITKTESISEDLYIIYKKYKFLFIDPTMDDQLYISSILEKINASLL